jgi:hypothetical protein
MDLTGASIEPATSSLTGGGLQAHFSELPACRLQSVFILRYRHAGWQASRVIIGGVLAHGRWRINSKHWACSLLLHAVGLEQDPSEALAHRAMCSRTTASDADYSGHGGVKICTMVPKVTDSLFCPPAHHIVGPVSVLIPDPRNVHGS